MAIMGSAEQKVVTRDQIPSLVRGLREIGKSVVTINGSFDMLHAGHVYILTEAKRQGDVLIVGLNSDASIKQYKGPNRPIIPQEYRARMLCALQCVDYVNLFDEPECLAFVESVKPDVHVNGGEYGPDCIEAGIVRQNGGRVHIVERIPCISTSEIIQKILAVYGPQK